MLDVFIVVALSRAVAYKEVYILPVTLVDGKSPLGPRLRREVSLRSLEVSFYVNLNHNMTDMAADDSWNRTDFPSLASSLLFDSVPIVLQWD
jgi:hypothetical protein